MHADNSSIVLKIAVCECMCEYMCERTVWIRACAYVAYRMDTCVCVRVLAYRVRTFLRTYRAFAYRM